MTELKFGSMVSNLAKPGVDIIRDLDETKAELAHMAMLLTTEAGELADIIKKHVIYNKFLDIEHMMEELGDIEFALERIRQLIKIDRISTLEHNMQKLVFGDKPRYPQMQYTNELAVERKDKN